MIPFVDEPMYTVKTLCRVKVYVLSTSSSNIVFSATSMLSGFLCMQQASACLSCSYKQTAVVACAGTCEVPPGSTGVLYSKISVFSTWFELSRFGRLGARV